MILALDAAPSDESNLQFAIIGMWVARRHGVPTDRALLLAEARMRKLQETDGRWKYDSKTPPSPTMTCAGILALAVGHAVINPHPASLKKELANDEQIVLAIKALGEVIEHPSPDVEKGVIQPKTFLLWSVERIGVLFNMPTIDGKDWYGWGCQSLIKYQKDDGSWMHSSFPGGNAHVETCLAVLFLTRSNLFLDISDYTPLPLPGRR
jgi:hypothetical protein